MPVPAYAEPEVAQIIPPLLGLMDTPQIAAMPPQAAIRLDNWDLSRQGMQLRKGSAIIGVRNSIHTGAVGCVHYRPIGGNDRVLQARTNGSNEVYLYEWNSTQNQGLISLATTATSADIISDVVNKLSCWVQHGTRLYYQPSNTRRYFDGTAIRLWGWQQGTLATGTTGANSAGGDLTKDQYYTWVYTLLNPTTGHETNPSAAPAAVQVTGTDLTMNVTVPAVTGWASQSDYTKARLYRTAGRATAALADGDADLKFEKEITYAGVPVATTLSILDGNLGAAVKYDDGPPPRFDAMILFKNRIVGITNVSDVRWSEDGNLHKFPPTAIANVGRDEADPPKGLAELNGQLYVIGNACVWRLTPTTTAAGTFTFAEELVSRSGGALSHHSILEKDGFLYYLGSRGAHRFDGSNPINISDAQIRQIMRTIAEEGLFSAAGIIEYDADYPWLRWTVPADDGTARRFHLIYDTAAGRWHKDTRPSVQGAGPAHQAFGYYEEPTTGARRILAVDNDGCFFQLRYDLGGNLVWEEGAIQGGGQADYVVGDFTSAWIGDGVSIYKPLYFDIELEAAAAGRGVGQSLGLFLDAYDTTGMTLISWPSGAIPKAIPLFEGTFNRPANSVRVNLPPLLGRRLRVRLQGGAGSDPRIAAAYLTFQKEPGRLSGI